MSRPQVSIDRLTPRRATVEPRETMNCKSCRKRKVCPVILSTIGLSLTRHRSNVIVCDRAARLARSSSAHVYMVC